MYFRAEKANAKNNKTTWSSFYLNFVIMCYVCILKLFCFNFLCDAQKQQTHTHIKMIHTLHTKLHRTHARKQESSKCESNIRKEKQLWFRFMIAVFMSSLPQPRFDGQLSVSPIADAIIHFFIYFGAKQKKN